MMKAQMGIFTKINGKFHKSAPRICRSPTRRCPASGDNFERVPTSYWCRSGGKRRGAYPCPAGVPPETAPARRRPPRCAWHGTPCPHGYRKIVGRAQGGDTGQCDVLPARKLLHLLEDLLASVDPRHDFIVKSSVFHRKTLLAFRFFLWYFYHGTCSWLSVKTHLKILRVLCT